MEQEIYDQMNKAFPHPLTSLKRWERRQKYIQHFPFWRIVMRTYDDDQTISYHHYADKEDALVNGKAECELNGYAEVVFVEQMP